MRPVGKTVLESDVFVSVGILVRVVSISEGSMSEEYGGDDTVSQVLVIYEWEWRDQ